MTIKNLFKMCKKLISIVLIFTLLITSNGNTFAQMLSDNLVNKYEIKELRDLVNTTVKSEIKSDIKVIDENFIRRAYQKEYNFHSLFESLNDQGFKNDYGEVCDDWARGEEGDKICAPYHTFMRGVIGALIDFSEGNGEILIEYTKEIKEAVYLGAVGSKDIEPLRTGLIEGSKKKLESCSVRKPNYKDEDECEKGLNGLLILGVLWENEKGAKENANVIYKALKGNMKKAYGPLVITEGIAALSYMDTDYSYSLIEKFLTDDSMPGKVGEGITRTLDLLSLSGIYDTWEAVISKAHKGGIRYLNRNNENWQYILEEETRKAGIDPVAIAKQNEEAMKWDKRYAETSYKVVYGNVLTDIGEFLAQSNERGKKLSNKIISSYVYDNKIVHLPLILGLIKGKNAAFDVKVGLAARRLNEGFYYDLNGGTGRYVAVNSALKGSGLSWKRQNVVSYEYYNTKVGISRVNFIGDMFINVVMSGMLVLSIPSIMKGIYNLGRLAKLSVRYGGKNVARMGRIVKGSEKAAAEAAKVQPEPKTKTTPKAEPKGQTKAGTTSTEWKPSTVQVMNKTEGATEVGSYNTSTGAVTDVTKVKPSQVKTATVGEGSGGASAEDALNGIRARTKRLRTSRNVNREVKELEIETAKAQAEPAKANNIFNKPYSQMNAVEKKIFDTYIRLELGGLGDLKAAIKDSKSLLTTRTGIKNTAASGLAFGTGEAPAVEARMLAKAPTEVVVNAEKGNIFNNPITLFDRAGLNSQIGSSGRGVRRMPNTFKGIAVKPVSLREPGTFINTLNGGLVTLRSAFVAPQGENPLITQQRAKYRNAAAFTGLLVGAGLTATFGVPAAIGTTLAMVPIFGMPKINPQSNSTGNNQENVTAGNESENDGTKTSSKGWRKIFGNSNKAKNNLNLSQQELQNFVNALTSFLAKDNISEEEFLNFLKEQSIKPVTETKVEHGTAGNDYEKTYKDFVAAFMALDFTKDPEQLAKKFVFDTGIDKFKFGGQILIKKGSASKDGEIKEDFERINTFYVSSKDFKLKENESLVMDSYGNIYKLSVDKNGKEVKQYYQNVIATQVTIPGLDMPIVVIGKTVDKLAVLNFLFMLMGFSSLGRFVNGPIKDLWPNLPEVVAMALGTGIYFTNLLAVPFKPLIDKLGAKKMVAFAIGEIIVASLLPTLFGMSGFTAINPTTVKLAVLATTSILYGSAAAGLQQVVNTTANNMLGGKEAGYVTAGGQMFKSIGSLSTYLFYAVAVGILGAQWPAMYWLMGIPGVIGAILLGMSDLPLQKSKLERLQEAADKGDKAAIEELAAINEGKPAKTKKKGEGDLSFILSWGGLPILAAIMMLCGSETLVSVTTKGLMKGWLGGMEFLNNDALQMAITGIITMGPALLGRLLAKSLMKKYKDVPQYNQKMLLIAAAVATASAAAIKLLGPSAGLYGLLFVVASNMTLSNFFTFEANIMKKYNNEKFDGKFDSLVGTLSTMGIVGCFLVPTLTSLIMPGATAFDNLIVPMILIPSAMALMIPHMKGANPLNWATPMKNKDMQTMSQEIAKDIEEAMANISEEDVAQTMAEIKADMAKELGISTEEVDTFLSTGVLPNISEENIRKLADFWGITNKDMKKFLNGKDTEIVLKKIQKNMENKLQQAMKESGISIDPKNMDPTLQN